MKYLNDEIYIDATLNASEENKYHVYNVKVKYDHTGAQFQTIYTGRIFYRGQARIYLNNILGTFLTLGDQISNLYNDGIENIGYISEYKNTNKLFTLEIEFPNSKSVYGNSPATFSYPDLIYTGYPLINNKVIDIKTNLADNTSKADIYVPWYMNNDIAPRYPYMPESEKLFIGVDFLLTKAAQTGDLAIRNGYEGAILTEWTNADFNNNTIFYRADRLARKKGDSLIVEYTSASGNKVIRELAKIDKCPADFYCIWVDRMGATQCQPFEKRSVMKENIDTSSLVDLRDRTRPYNKSIEYSWDLNTDWVDEKSYRTYESILTSPYIYLFDSKQDLGYWVICDQNEWTEKTTKNQTQLFNFNITLTANRNQNILY